jgi:hypothetical protein
VLFAYSLPGPDGHNPLWAGMGYPGPVQNPPDSRKTLEVITVSGETTLEADVVVVGSGSGGGGRGSRGRRLGGCAGLPRPARARP